MIGRHCLGVLVLLLPVLSTRAESVYITDKLQVGLHEDKQPDSPITLVLPSGTALEVVKREERMTFVRTAGGINGWVDNSYLLPVAPTAERINALTARNAALEQQLKSLQAGGAVNDAAKLSGDYAALQQQYRSEQLKVGELEVTIAELRKRLGQDNATDALYKEIDALRETNKALEIKLSHAQPGAETAADDQPVAATTAGAAGVFSADRISFSWRNLLILILVLLSLGLGGGVYLMDYFSRRRHGGFRI